MGDAKVAGVTRAAKRAILPSVRPPGKGPAMPSDALAELTRLQEQEERAVEAMERHQRELATLQALLADARGRGDTAAVGIEARVRTEEEGVARAEREIAALRERIVASEKALPLNLKDDDEEA
jgi:hypothetical protein